jgi:hypothetical protein
MKVDPFGISVKDLSTQNVLTMCNSSGGLYTMRLHSCSAPSPCVAPVAALVASTSTWHHCLGHPGVDTLSKLSSDSSVICSMRSHDFCHACQLGRHTLMPFVSSTSHADNNFNLIHCDLWTSPVVSVSGYKYYLVILDDCSHFVWIFPLRVKSDTFSILLKKFAFVSTQFGRTIKVVHCNNGREFDNASSRAFFATHGVVLRMSYPYTSLQNSKTERTLRTINNMIHSLLFQGSFPARYWVKGLHTATYLLNRLPSKMICAPCPYVALHSVAPSYEHLRVFGCACYPNLSVQASHKLAPRFTRCVFLGYSTDHKGYRCLDLSTNNIIVFRHVIFDEADFPFATSPCLTNDLDIFLQDDSPGAVPMPAPLPVPHVPLGFLPLAAASGQTSHPGGQTAPGTEAGGPTTNPGGQPMIRIGAGGPTMSPGGPTARPYASPPSPASPTSAASRKAPSTLAAPHVASMTPVVPPTTLVSQLYPLHYSRRPQAAQEPPTPPLHQQTSPAKAVPVAPPVNPHPMTTRAKRGFRIPADKLSLSATSSSTLSLSLVPTSVRAALTDLSWRRAMEEEYDALIANNT